MSACCLVVFHNQGAMADSVMNSYVLFLLLIFNLIIQGPTNSKGTSFHGAPVAILVGKWSQPLPGELQLLLTLVMSTLNAQYPTLALMLSIRILTPTVLKSFSPCMAKALPPQQCTSIFAAKYQCSKHICISVHSCINQFFLVLVCDPVLVCSFK